MTTGAGRRTVILGLSITSSWANGHATGFRALVAALARRGHDVLFLERDLPWYAAHRDQRRPRHGRVALYRSLPDLVGRFGADVAAADLVVVGSYVPDGLAIGRWVTQVATGVHAFYDIDTPVTLAALDRGRCTYLDRDLVAAFDLYLSFTAGPTLTRLEDLGARRAVAFPCFADPAAHRPEPVAARWDLGYLGTYEVDRQPALERLLIEPARRRPDLRFVVAGSRYPDALDWPPNVERIGHVPPAEHNAFYAAQRFTLNVTRADMVRAGWSPSVRLFEAAACGVPVISDRWDGLGAFFADDEIVVADGTEEVLATLDGASAADAAGVGARARRRVLDAHTADHRAAQLEREAAAVRSRRGAA
ncbi:MAG: hypothetical protein JWM05_3157 [Acidimicrobiales bacterium]|nr:hypothetical protein [Acidimicrobiales bacterium]